MKLLSISNVSRCFPTKEELSKHISKYIPFTSNNARQIVEDKIVECLLNNG